MFSTTTTKNSVHKLEAETTNLLILIITDAVITIQDTNTKAKRSLKRRVMLITARLKK